MKRRKGGEGGLRPLKQRRTKKQLAKKAARSHKRKERKKVIPSG